MEEPTEESKDLYCAECGERIKADESEGVYVHDTEDIDLGYDLNEDHAARPDLELSDELRVVSTQ